MSGIVVGAAVHLTDARPASLSVINFHNVPPHHGPGLAATRAPAGAERAARTAAAAAAVTTRRILGPPRSVNRSRGIIVPRSVGAHARSSDQPSFGSSTPSTLRSTIRP